MSNIKDKIINTNVYKSYILPIKMYNSTVVLGIINRENASTEQKNNYFLA